MYRRAVSAACASAAARGLPATHLVAPTAALLRIEGLASCRALSGSALCRASAPAAPSASASAATSATAQAPSNPSVVEEWVAKKEAKKRAAELANPPVPVGEGETLLYVGGATTKRNIMIQYAMPGFLGIYAMTIYSISDKVDNIIGMAPNTVVIGASAIAGVMGMLAFATSKSAMRAAVLTEDGYHLRVYPYGSFFGLGHGTPVTVPIKLLSQSVAAATSKAGTEAIYVSVKNSPVFLAFDKPNVMDIQTSTGTGLAFTKKGLASIQAGKAASSGVSILPPTAVYSLPPEQRAEFRRYALLVHVLNGHPVNMEKVLDGSWELEHMVEQLDPNFGKSGKDQRLEDLKYWKRAQDASGRDYWWHEVTWQRQWIKPTVDGLGPEDVQKQATKEADK